MRFLNILIILLLVLYNIARFCFGIYEIYFTIKLPTYDITCGYVWLQLIVMGVINIISTIITFCDLIRNKNNTVEQEAAIYSRYSMGPICYNRNSGNDKLIFRNNLIRKYWQFSIITTLVGIWLQVTYYMDVRNECLDCMVSYCMGIVSLFMVEVVMFWIVIGFSLSALCCWYVCQNRLINMTDEISYVYSENNYYQY